MADYHKITFIAGGGTSQHQYVSQQALTELTKRIEGAAAVLDLDTATTRLTDVTELVLEYDKTASIHPIHIVVANTVATDAVAKVEPGTPENSISASHVSTTNHGACALFVVSPPPTGATRTYVLGGNAPGFTLRVTIRYKP